MTMEVSQALGILGARRVIWIDDRFNNTPAQLALMLTNSLEIAVACEFPELQDAFATADIDLAGTLQSITQILTDLPGQRLEEMQTAFFAKEGENKQFPANELSTATITSACQLLGVADADRWTFQKANADLPGLCAVDDTELGYIVDLNEAGGLPMRGMEMLRILWRAGSKGAAFILTHETDIAGEARMEVDLRAEMADLGGLGLPICVIAKERLTGAAENGEDMAEALRVGVKRAGLRRSLHCVLASVRDRLSNAIDKGLWNLLSVPPEVLDTVFERGYKEGVSELHVVERAITAHMGKEAREFFGESELVQANVQRLRALRAIPLRAGGSTPDPHLMAFRLAEVWENEELLNRSLTPISCGDVFELDQEENKTKSARKKFVLLGQPCDISLRPESKRAQDVAFLVPLKVKSGNHSAATKKEKEPLLPFVLENEQWACDFRSAAAVRLAILDLASFREDGRVRIDDGHSVPAGLLVGQEKVYEERTKVVSAALADSTKRPAEGTCSLALQLTFDDTEAFKHIHFPLFEESSQKRENNKTITRPKRATWCLRRCGRIRMPYAAALLDQYTSVMSRWAFDLDFISPGVEASGATAEAPSEGIAAAEPVGNENIAG